MTLDERIAIVDAALRQHYLYQTGMVRTDAEVAAYNAAFDALRNLSPAWRTV